MDKPLQMRFISNFQNSSFSITQNLAKIVTKLHIIMVKLYTNSQIDGVAC